MSISAIPGLDNRGAIATNCNAKMRRSEIYKIYCNDGQYRTFGIFDVKIGNIQNIFYMMGLSELKLTFTLDEWAVGKQMAQE